MKKCCTAHHDDKLCFLPNCRYHIGRKGDFIELLQKMDAFFFTYQKDYCVYTLFKYPFREKTVAKSGQVFDSVQRSTYFNQWNWRLDKMPRTAKNDCWQKGTKRIYWFLYERQNQGKKLDQYSQKKLKWLKRLNMNWNY